MAELLIILVGIVIVICLLTAVWDSNRFVTVTYEILSDRVTKPCRFVLLADLHNKSFGRDHERLIGEIDRIAPDAILVAGDMLTAVKGKSCEPALSLMRQLAARYKIYYGMGNHEYRLKLYPEQYGGIYETYVSGLSAAGIEPLINENTYLPEYNIAVCGSMIDRRYYRRLRKCPMEADYLTKLLGEPRRDACQILIAHTPQYFEEYAAWGADVVVAGHVHGGIVRLPFFGGLLSPNITFFPKYDGGRYVSGRTTMILSRGLSSHTPPLRLFNPGELAVITLTPQSVHGQKGQA